MAGYYYCGHGNCKLFSVFIEFRWYVVYVKLDLCICLNVLAVGGHEQGHFAFNIFFVGNTLEIDGNRSDNNARYDHFQFQREVANNP